MKEELHIHLSNGKISLCILMFVLGQTLHLFWLKIPALKERARVANLPFSLKAYFKSDWNIIAGMQIVGIVIIIGLGSILNLRPALADYIEWIFFFIAFSGSTATLAKLSKFDGAINTIVDVKTNIADSK